MLCNLKEKKGTVPPQKTLHSGQCCTETGTGTMTVILKSNFISIGWIDNYKIIEYDMTLNILI